MTRLQTFTEKFPDRAERLDRVIGPLIGQTGREEGRIAREALDQVEARILAAIYGEDAPVIPELAAKLSPLGGTGRE